MKFKRIREYEKVCVGCGNRYADYASIENGEFPLDIEPGVIRKGACLCKGCAEAFFPANVEIVEDVEDGQD